MTVSVARASRWIGVALLASALGGAAPARAEAALARAPFDVSLVVSPDAAGSTVTLRAERRSGSGGGTGEPFDLYVARLKNFQEVSFLTPAGTWSSERVSVRPGLSTTDLDTLSVRWPERGLGSVHLLVIAARPSANPLIPSGWLFRPVLRVVAFRARLSDAPNPTQARLALCALGALSAIAAGLVLWLPRSLRAEPAAPVAARTSPSG